MSEKTRAQIASIQVGLPREWGMASASDPLDKPWTSGIFKEAVAGPVMVGRLNIAGDGQADLRVHGGPDKAVLAYAAEHYASWIDELQLDEMPHGGFGENLTIAELTEADVCIGDLWRVNRVLLQVSQPRQPCWKLARRWRRLDLPKRVIQTGRCGWYLRVLEEGVIERGMGLDLEERRSPQWTVAQVASLMYDKHADRDALAALAVLPELATSWREDFARKL